MTTSGYRHDREVAGCAERADGGMTVKSFALVIEARFAGQVSERPESSTSADPPLFMLRMRQVIDDAVAGHSHHLSVVHKDKSGPGVYGWESTLQLTGHPEVEAVFWYDGLDDDVMFWGDAPFGEWWPNEDERAAQACLGDVRRLVEDLAGAGGVAAVAQAGRRQYLEGRAWWRRLLFPRASERWL